MSNETKVEVEDVASYIKYINELSPTIDGDARTSEHMNLHLFFEDKVLLSTISFRQSEETAIGVNRDRTPFPLYQAALSTRLISLKLLAAYCQMFLNENCFRLIF